MEIAYHSPRILIYAGLILSCSLGASAVPWGRKSSCLKPSLRAYADPTDCHQYHKCINGVQFTARCRPGMVFDRDKFVCANSALNPCTARESGHSLIGKKCAIQGEIIPSQITCDKYLLCRSGRYYKRSCPFGLIFSNLSYKCIVPPDPCAVSPTGDQPLLELNIKREDSPYIGLCDNRVNQSVPEPFDCSMYVFCEEDYTDPENVEIAMVFTECPKGTLFSAQTKTCIEPARVICDTRYRIVTLYGKDPIPMAPLGRGIGSQPSAPHVSRQPETPRFGPQPGKYRAITKSTPKPANTSASTETPGTRTSDSGFVLKTINHNGVIIQAPIQASSNSTVNTASNANSNSTLLAEGKHGHGPKEPKRPKGMGRSAPGPGAQEEESEEEEDPSQIAASVRKNFESSSLLARIIVGLRNGSSIVYTKYGGNGKMESVTECLDKYHHSDRSPAAVAKKAQQVPASSPALAPGSVNQSKRGHKTRSLDNAYPDGDEDSGESIEAGLGSNRSRVHHGDETHQGANFFEDYQYSVMGRELNTTNEDKVYYKDYKDMYERESDEIVEADEAHKNKVKKKSSPDSYETELEIIHPVHQAKGELKKGQRGSVVTATEEEYEDETTVKP